MQLGFQVSTLFRKERPRTYWLLCAKFLCYSTKFRPTLQITVEEYKINNNQKRLGQGPIHSFLSACGTCQRVPFGKRNISSHSFRRSASEPREPSPLRGAQRHHRHQALEARALVLLLSCWGKRGEVGTRTESANGQVACISQRSA